jgi:glutamate-5-semialdehyde dehydrogenase
VQLIEDGARESVGEFLRQRQALDVVIPRGGAGLISYVCEHSSVPVIETGAGVCHVFVDESAPADMVTTIVLNAKTQRPSVCNAIETLLVHEAWAAANLLDLAQQLQAVGVTLKGCAATRALVPGIQDATEEDWATEYLALTLAVRIVDSVEAAVEHITQYGTRHSESILSVEQSSVDYFLQHVDAAAVYHNASTRFTDGFEFGFGAEIGISTQKLHARGPMGLPELTSYKYVCRGTGQARA